ncbi:MAG: OmpA family protein [Kineosporiaceae bacterium]
MSVGPAPTDRRPRTRVPRAIAAASATAVVVAAVPPAAWWVARGVEAELTIEAQATLAAAGIPVRVDYDGRDARLRGRVADPDAAARASRLVSDVRGTRSVVSDLRVDAGPGPSSAEPAPSPPPSPAPSPPPSPGPTDEVPPLPPATVRFDDATAELSPAAREVLDAVAGHLVRYPDVRVVVEGHTDSTGSVESNRRLSGRRADAVLAYLVSRGVPPGRMEAAGYADSRPVASDDTAEGRAANRRVEIVAVAP